MSPHPRIRKTVKWGGAAVTVLLLVVWIGSGWLCIWWGTLPFNVKAWCGTLMVNRFYAANSPTPPLPSFGIERAKWEMHWSPLHESHTLGWRVELPLWIPAFLTSLPTLVAWRLDALARRCARLNFCANCNYDRTGLTQGAVCPECGSTQP